MGDWQESRSLRAFAKAIGEATARLGLSDQEKNDIQQVVDWTCDYANILDPISNLGSAQESDEVRILSGFLERDEFGLGGGQTLRLQQQVVEIAIAATTTQ